MSSRQPCHFIPCQVNVCVCRINICHTSKMPHTFKKVHDLEVILLQLQSITSISTLQHIHIIRADSCLGYSVDVASTLGNQE